MAAPLLVAATILAIVLVSEASIKYHHRHHGGKHHGYGSKTITQGCPRLCDCETDCPSNGGGRQLKGKKHHHKSHHKSHHKAVNYGKCPTECICELECKDGGGIVKCKETADCPKGLVCVDGKCVAEGGPTDCVALGGECFSQSECCSETCNLFTVPVLMGTCASPNCCVDPPDPCVIVPDGNNVPCCATGVEPSVKCDVRPCNGNVGCSDGGFCIDGFCNPALKDCCGFPGLPICPGKDCGSDGALPCLDCCTSEAALVDGLPVCPGPCGIVDSDEPGVAECCFSDIDCAGEAIAPRFCNAENQCEVSPGPEPEPEPTP
mmetsp:Transcript_9371/g.26999  ORF Transcript_9371/g.26999 Transcript_9371/m.26999 type:complete len:320 (+) Transcript_9371:62-1021(+)